MQATEQSPAAQVQSALLDYKGEPLSMNHPIIVAIRAWLPDGQISGVITAAQRGYQGNAAADALASIAEKSRLWWNRVKYVAVMLATMLLCSTVNAGVPGGGLFGGQSAALGQRHMPHGGSHRSTLPRGSHKGIHGSHMHPYGGHFSPFSPIYPGGQMIGGYGHYPSGVVYIIR